MEDDIIPGNYEMKYQIMGLRQVKENIAKFRSNPGQVMIFLSKYR